jgi:polyribonucleotide nucleotidyltransferase
MCCMVRWIIPGFSSLRNEGSDRGPRREREGGSNRPVGDGGPEPEFAPAFLTREDD